MTDQEFRKKYMYEEPNYKERLYDISLEERNMWSKDITPDVYTKYRNIWLKQAPEERVLDDDLTFGQYKTYVALAVKYGLGYFRHSPTERLELCNIWEDETDDNWEKSFSDYDWFVRKSVSEMDKRFITFIKKIQGERKKYVDFYSMYY